MGTVTIPNGFTFDEYLQGVLPRGASPKVRKHVECVVTDVRPDLPRAKNCCRNLMAE